MQPEVSTPAKRRAWMQEMDGKMKQKKTELSVQMGVLGLYIVRFKIELRRLEDVVLIEGGFSTRNRRYFRALWG